MKKAATRYAYAIIVTTSLILPTTANASESKQIFFTGGSIYDTGIYKMDEDSNEVVRITDGISVDVSPNGKKLAFIKNDSLFVSDHNGKNQVQLTHSQFPVFDASPRWSPDGKKIVFSRSDGNIYTIDANGKNLVNLTKTDEKVYNSEPDWSPDGSQIVFHSDRTGRSHIFVMNSDGSNVKQLTGDKENRSAEYSAHFSPDGKKILFGKTTDGNSDLFVMNADGTGSINLTQDIEEAIASPIWSEDGKKILFTLNEKTETDQSNIQMMDADGTNKAALKLDIELATPYDWHSLGAQQEETKNSSGLSSAIDYLSDWLFN